MKVIVIVFFDSPPSRLGRAACAVLEKLGEANEANAAIKRHYRDRKMQFPA